MKMELNVVDECETYQEPLSSQPRLKDQIRQKNPLNTYLPFMFKGLVFLFIMALNASTYAQDHYMITGSYTHGKSNGIYVYIFNTNTASYRLVDSVKTFNPSYLAVSSDNKFIYAVNEQGKDKGGGTITAFSFDKNSGKLQTLNSQSSEGNNPCYITVDKTGRWLLVGNYSSGTAAVLPIGDDGSLGAAISVVQHEGSGTNKKRQEAPHVHATVLSADNKYLYLPDLGIDKLVAYAFDEKTGSLQFSEANTVKLEDGSGPRHMDFHPRQPWAYLLNELSGTVTVFQRSNERLLKIQTVSSLPADFQLAFTSADIHVSPDGKFLYASNRDESNTIAIFKIDQENGMLTLVGHQPTMGKTPRNFSLDPTGNFLLVANQNSDNIVIFRVDKHTGLLRYSEQTIETGNPVCIKWAGAVP